jgi:hypothetical protein
VKYLGKLGALLLGPLDGLVVGALAVPGDWPTVREDEREVIQRWRAKSSALR